MDKIQAVPEMEWYQCESPNITSYFENRFKPAIGWYNKKASDHMRRFHLLQVIIIVMPVMIPIINLVPNSNSNDLKLLSAILGGIIVGVTSILQSNQISRELANFQKNRREAKKRVSTILASYRKLLG